MTWGEFKNFVEKIVKEDDQIAYIDVSSYIEEISVQLVNEKYEIWS